MENKKKSRVAINKYYSKILLLFIFISNFAFSQQCDYFPYYQSINSAELAHKSKFFLEADSFYQNAFNNVPRPFNQDLFLAAVNAMDLKNYEKVVAYLKEGFSLGLQYKQLEEHEMYPALKTQIKLKKLKKEFKSRRKIYQNNLDKKLIDIMKSMDERDQKPRSEKYDNMPWKVQQKYMKRADSMNYAIVVSYFEQDIFLGISNLGENNPGKYNVSDLSLLMRHMSVAQLNELKPYFVKAIKEGEIHPWFYASAYDHVNMYKTTIEDRDENGRPILIIQQTYGTFYYTNDDGELELYAIENLERANELRKELGLETIQEYALKQSLKLPIEGEFNRTF